MACVQPLPEKRPLKRPRLGPPDFFPQEPKQSEDDLTPDKLRQGYCYRPPLSTNEYESGRYPKLEEKLDEYYAKVIQSYNVISTKKNDINTLQDAAKKKAVVREPFWHTAARPKKEAWFRDLAGNKTLAFLTKKEKVPFFNKRDEIFSTLAEFSVPMSRAIWFIKMTNVNVVQQQEAGKKKKQMMDPCIEWTNNLTTFLRQLFSKLSDYYSPLSQSSATAEGTIALKQWNYCTKLARCMFEEGLLEKQEFLTWMMEIFAEKCRSSDESALKLILPVVMQYLDGVLRSELLSRKLAYLCCKKLSHYYIDAGPSSPTPSQNEKGQQHQQQQQQQQHWYTEYLNCTFHRSIMYSLSVIVQSILIECPTALVWNPNNFKLNAGNSESSRAFLYASPLDILPSFPSQLPIPDGPSREMIEDELKNYENDVKVRSLAVDSHWSFDNREQSGLSSMVQCIISALESLDRQYYDKSNDSNNLNTLYARIFSPDSKETEDGSETILVKFLCHWAVTSYRSGCHRALVVVRLLEKRRADLQQQTVSDGSCDKISAHCFQSILFDYLDNEAPVLTTDNSRTSKTQFSNLIFLYTELIRADLYSHDAYLRTLISRGDISNQSYQMYAQQQQQEQQSSTTNQQQTSSTSLITNVLLPETKKTEENDFTEAKEPEDVKLDIDKLLATIDRQGSSSDNYQSGRFEKPPMSVGSSYPGSVDPSMPVGVESQTFNASLSSSTKIRNPSCNVVTKSATLSRHFGYVMHFILPQDDQYKHECNQRQALLFGCGPTRDVQKYNIRKVLKDLNKLWHKKNSVECSSSNGVLKIKRKMNADVLKTIIGKFSSLVRYDHFVVLDACSDASLDQLRDFASGQLNYLPNPENLDFFLRLHEFTPNLFGMVEYIEALLSLLPKVESQLSSKNCQTGGAYVLNVTVCCVGYLSKYLSYVIFSTSELISIWKLLYNMVNFRELYKNNPSAERCILCFLNETYICCEDVRNSCSDQFATVKERIEAAFVPEVHASLTGKFEWGRKFASEYFEDPKKTIDSNLLKLLNDHDENRFNFVANAVCSLISNKNNVEKIFDICKFCADVTAYIPSLANEWVAVLKILTCNKVSGVKQPVEFGSADFVTSVDICDSTIHHPLAVLVHILLSRCCIRMETFVIIVAMHVFMPLYQKMLIGPPPNSQLDPTFKLEKEVDAAVHLVLYWCTVIFLKTEIITDQFGPQAHCIARMQGELYLSCSTLRLVEASTVLTLFITLLIFGELADEIFANFSENANHLFSILEAASSDGCARIKKKRCLSTFINDFLYNVCQQEWAKHKFVQPCSFLDDGLFLNPLQSHLQAQKMLRMVARSWAESEFIYNLEMCQTKKDLTSRILQNLSMWNMNASLLDLELLVKQAASLQSQSAQQLQELDDLIAKAAIEVFRTSSDALMAVSRSPKKNSFRLSQAQFRVGDIKSGWLVAPLVSKLPSSVQGRVLKAAATVLENGQLSRRDKGNINHGSSLLGQQPFLSLVLTCLRGQDDQREALLGSLLKQLQEYCMQAKDDRYQFCARENVVELRESLKLRLSLVGGMFETVCKSSTVDTWALLLLQLLLYGIITIEFDQQLYYTCIDMLCILIHSCLIPDPSGGNERTVDDCKKLHNNITKKLKKEMGDRYIPTLKAIYQLLPIPRQYQEVVACDVYGSQPSKNVKTGTPISLNPAFDTNTRKGLQVVGKERISPWDLIEGYRGDSFGSKWSLFQAVRVDCQPDTVVTQLNRIVSHDHYHAFKRPCLPGESRPDYFLEPLQVQYDQTKVHEMEKNASKDDTMTPVSQCGSIVDFVDQVMSPRGKTIKTKKTSTTSTRGGRKGSRGAATSYNNVNIRQIGLPSIPATNTTVQQMQPYPTAMQVPQQQQQQQQAAGMPPTMQPQQQQYGGAGSVMPPQYSASMNWATQTSVPMPTPATAMPQFQPRSYQPAMVPQQMAGNPRIAISARIRHRHQSGTNPMIGDVSYGALPPQSRQATFVQHLDQKMNEPFPSSQVQQQMQAQIEQHRQQLINENAAAMMDTNVRPQMHRHMTGPLDHPDMMRQQQGYPVGAYPSGNIRMQQAAMAGSRSPAYVGGAGGGGGGSVYQSGPSNPNQSFNPGGTAGQYFASVNEQQNRMAAAAAAQQQGDMMMTTSGIRYGGPISSGQMQYSMPAQSAMGRGAGAAAGSYFIPQQQQQQLAQQSQAAMVHQQQQQQQQISYGQGVPQHFQQQPQQQQSGQMFQMQRMPSYGNMQMEPPTPMNFYQQQY